MHRILFVMVDSYTERPTEVREYEKHTTRTPISHDAYPHTNGEVIDARDTYHEKKRVFRSYNTIWFIVSIIVALLAFRFVFELLGANPYNAFVQFVYTLSYPFAGPFQTIFGVTSVARATFDWSLLVAIIVYVLIGYALIQLLRIIHPISSDDVHHGVHTV